MGTAFGAAEQLDASGQGGLASALHDAASAAFFHGFATAVVVAAGIAVAGAVMALVLIPSQPPAVSVAESDASAGLAAPTGQAG